MSMEDTRSTLKKVASIFRAGGSKAQATALDDLEKLLADSGDRSIEQFVERSRPSPPLKDLAVTEIVRKLDDAKIDAAAFALILTAIEAKNFPKAKAIGVAVGYTGAIATRLKSKADALKAISSKFDERVYHSSKEAMNSKVTPW
jgi:hypothetical protein